MEPAAPKDAPDPAAELAASLSSAVAGAVALGAFEAAHYGRELRFAELGVTSLDRAFLFWTIAGLSLWLLAPAFVVTAVLLRRGRRRAALGLATLATAVVLGALAVDLRSVAVTGAHFSRWLAELDVRNPWQWGGASTGVARTVVETSVVTTLVVLVLTITSQRLSRRARPGKRLAAVPAVVFAAGLAGPTVAALAVTRPLAHVRLASALPVRPPGLAARLGTDDVLSLLNARLEPLGPTLGSPLRLAAVPRDVALVPDGSPHVLWIVVESLRHDAIDARVMPRVHAWSQRGLTLERHYAGSNVSELGLFTPLYGRSPLAFQQTIGQQVPAPLTRALAAAGYERRYIGSSQVDWHGMQHFLSPLNFDSVHADDQDDWPTRDRSTLALARAAFAKGKPTFVFSFLVSTHFDYRYPDEYRSKFPGALERRHPWAGLVSVNSAPESMRQGVYDRYRNSLAFLDDAIADLVEALDPARHVVVLIGDHGESFHDDGTWLHSGRLSDVQTRTPCVIVGKGVPSGRITKPTWHGDLPATMLHAIAGREVDHGTHGRDLLSPSFTRDQVLLVGRLQDEAVLVRDEGRLHLRISPDGRSIRTEGFQDASGRFLAELPSPPPSPEAWARAVERELVWLGR